MSITSHADSEKDYTKELNSIIVILHKLHNNLAADRSRWLEVDRNLDKTVRELEEQIAELMIVTPDFKQELKLCLAEITNKASKDISQLVSNGITAALTNSIDKLVQDLNQTIFEAKAQITISETKLQNMQWWAAVIIVLTCLLSGAIGAGLIRWSFPTKRLSIDEHTLIHNGYILSQVWDRLEKVEQDKILKLYNNETIAPTLSLPPKAEKKNNK